MISACGILYNNLQRSFDQTVDMVSNKEVKGQKHFWTNFSFIVTSPKQPR